MFTTMMRNQWLTSLMGMFFLAESNGMRNDERLNYQMMFFGLGAKLTFHSWSPSALLSEIFGRRSALKHVGRNFERTLNRRNMFIQYSIEFYWWASSGVANVRKANPHFFSRTCKYSSSTRCLYVLYNFS